MEQPTGQEVTLPDVNDLLPSEPCVNEEQRDEAQADAGIDDGDQLSAKTATDVPNSMENMSKSALKKMRKRQEWEAGREDRKAKKKQLKKARQERHKEAKARGEIIKQPVKERNWTVQQPVPITLVIDASYDSLMTEAEHISLCGQVSRCYHDVRNGQYRPVLAVTSFGGRMKERFDNVLEGHHKRWKGVHFVEEPFDSISELATSWMQDIAPKPRQKSSNRDDAVREPEQAVSQAPARLVYLSADSPHVLTTLDSNTCYIIGGLVDRNRHKGVCYEAAEKAGIPTARLPIGEYIKLSSRQVLTTNHVIEIMVKYLENHDWAKSFLEVIPTRKGVGSKEVDDNEDVIDNQAHADIDVEENDDEQTNSPINAGLDVEG